MSALEHDRIDFIISTIYYLSTLTRITYCNGFCRSRNHMNSNMQIIVMFTSGVHTNPNEKNHFLFITKIVS